MSRVVLLTVCALLVSACVAPASSLAPQSASIGTGSPIASSASAAPIAPLSRSLQGATLANDRAEPVIVSASGLFAVGSTTTKLTAPAPGASMQAVSGDSNGLISAAVTGTASVSVSTSADGGRTWAPAGAIAISHPDGISGISAASNGGRLAVLANESGSSNFRRGAVMASANGGSTWAEDQAPVGGVLTSATSSFWIVGGVGANLVYRSTDGTSWTEAAAPTTDPSWSAGPLTGVGESDAVLPVTSHNGATSTLTFYATVDQGLHWSALASVQGPPTEFGTVIPTAVAPDGSWMMIWPDGSTIVTGTLAQQTFHTIHPVGMPMNVSQVLMTSSMDAVVIATPDSCPTGKQSCTTTLQIVRSADGGATWSVVPKPAS